MAAGQVAHGQTPVAHWTFDDNVNDYTNGTVLDTQTAGGTSNAVWADPTTDHLAYTAGIIGGAVRLNGLGNSWFEISSIPELANIAPLAGGGEPIPGTGITFSAWFYSEGRGENNQGIIASREVEQDPVDNSVKTQDAFWGLAYRTNTAQIETRAEFGILSSNDAAPAGQWHHLVMAWGADATTPSDFEVEQIAYLNGSEVARRTTNHATQDIAEFISSGLWTLGRDPINSNCCKREFIGSIDDVAIFDEFLDGSEVMSLYQDGVAGINASNAFNSNTVTPTLLPGDVNGVGNVTMADFDIILANFREDVTGRDQGDLNGDRVVDLDDFAEWLNVASPQMQQLATARMSASVPEPSSVCLLLGIAVVGGVVRRHTLARSVDA